MKRKRRRKKQSPVFVVILLVLVFVLNFTVIKELFPKRKNELISAYIDPSNLSYDGFFHYEDETLSSITGIDISNHNTITDYAALKEQGIEFIYIRLGYRGYSEGKIHLDPDFQKNLKNTKNDYEIGVYFFSQAIDEEEARQEARFVLDHIKKADIDLPVAYDYEDGDDNSRIASLSTEQRTKNAIAFLDYIISHGYPAILYTNLDWQECHYDFELLKEYDIWFAQYHETPDTIYPFSIWQYSESGTLDGIKGHVDLNMMLVPKEDQR